MAEREGFEPSMQLSPHTRLAGERLQPLGHLSAYFTFSVKEELVLWIASFLRTSGGSRIRTHVPFPGSGFQDRRLKPLGHPSDRIISST